MRVPETTRSRPAIRDPTTDVQPSQNARGPDTMPLMATRKPQIESVAPRSDLSRNIDMLLCAELRLVRRTSPSLKEPPMKTLAALVVVILAFLTAVL
jgi:hypothetical protein